MTHMLTPSPLHVVESPCRISCTPAALQQKHNWGGDHASSGNSSSTDLAADGVATGSAASSENGLARGAPGSCRLPLIMPASAADLPVQAVLKELDELLAWQTSRSPAAHQSAQGSAAAHVTAGNADAAADNVIRAASQHLDEKEEEGDRSLVTQWLQATQQQHSALCRGNSASWAASEDSFYMSGLNSNSSTLRPMRRSNSMPTGHSQVSRAIGGLVASRLCQKNPACITRKRQPMGPLSVCTGSCLLLVAGLTQHGLYGCFRVLLQLMARLLRVIAPHHTPTRQDQQV